MGMGEEEYRREVVDEVVALLRGEGGEEHLRALLAERYLPVERYSLTEISQILGFGAPSAFSRWFRQRFGVSPSEWRASGRPEAG